MSIKPMLRRGYFVAPHEGGYAYHKVKAEQEQDGSLTIVRGPSELFEEGFIVVSTKLVYRALKNDFFTSTVAADRAIPSADIAQGWTKYDAGAALVPLESNTTGDADSDNDVTDPGDRAEDLAGEADQIVADQIKMLFG